MLETANDLRQKINTYLPLFQAISEDQAAAKPMAEKWSYKEIIGHLIDSATNNHQRFVRMQQVANIGKFAYDQNHWVSRQNYQSRKWSDLLQFWSAYNLHLAHVIENTDDKCLNNLCDMNYETPQTLAFVATDYVKHLVHHVNQILSDAPNEQSGGRKEV